MSEKRTINITIWSQPATVSISDDVLRWVYIADSVELHRHRIVLLMRYIIKNKKFKLDSKRLLDAYHKADEEMLKMCMSQEAVDYHHACDVIMNSESVNSKYYIHKFKG